MKRPIETASFACAALASTVGLVSLGLFVFSMLARLFSSNWDGFGLEEFFSALFAAVYFPLLLGTLALILVGVQAWLDVRDNE